MEKALDPIMVHVSADVSLDDAATALNVEYPADDGSDNGSNNSDGSERCTNAITPTPSDGEKPAKRRGFFRFRPRAPSAPKTAIWDTLPSDKEFGTDEEGAASSSLAYERWRRKNKGERRDLWHKITAKFQQPKRAEWDRLTAAIRAGVPTTLRGQVWYACSGAANKKQESKHAYWDFVAAGLDLQNEARAIIEIDVPRTGISVPMRGPLRNVLIAFAAKNPEIGYCQSMNFITAAILVYADEERAFWILCSLIEDLLPPHYYTTSMTGVRADMRLLNSLIKQYLPQLQRHLVSQGIDLSPITMNWFLCLFVNTLPAERSHRVLDCLFHEGPKVLFRAALALLKMKEPGILESSAVVDAYQLLRAPLGYDEDGESGDATPRLGTHAPGATEGEPDRSKDLLAVMYGLWVKGLSTDALDHLREEHVKDIEAEDRAEAARREAQSQPVVKAGPPLGSEGGDGSVTDGEDGAILRCPAGLDTAEYDESYFANNSSSEGLLG